jgi:hypothetical protein
VKSGHYSSHNASSGSASPAGSIAGVCAREPFLRKRLGVFAQSTKMIVMRCSRRWLAPSQIRTDVAADLPCLRRCCNLAPQPLPAAAAGTSFTLMVALTVANSRVSDARVM